jgi:N-acetylneuraminic acid mutarotase
MNRLKNLSLVGISIVLLGIACTKNDSATTTSFLGNWVKRSAFDGNGRSGAVSFVIADVGYIATGYDGTTRYNDLWSFNPSNQTWSQKAFMPTAAPKRNLASAFSIGNKAYIVGGACDANLGFNGRLKDNWEYDVPTNSWTQKADLLDPNATVGSSARYSAVGFSISGKGYISTGYSGTHLKDIIEYNPTSDSWVFLPSMPSSDKRQGASVLVYNNKAYIFGGISNGTVVNDMWSFDPSNSTSPWTQMRNITNTSTESFDDNYNTITRSNGVAFVIGTKGFYTTGLNIGYNSTTWEYDFATDVWTQKTNYERAARADAIGFSANGRGFVALGSSSTLYFDNMDEFKPADEFNSND